MKQLHGVSGIAGVVGSPRAARDLLAGRRITVTLWIVLLATASAAFPQAVTVTLEQPKVQQSSLFSNAAAFGATNVSVETFNELSPGFRSTSFPFAGNTSLGSYDHGQIQKADAFGGSGGTGNYLTVNQSIKPASNPTTLIFAIPQRYFGMWWSAGDPNNVVQFFSGSTLLETFRTNDVVNFINASPNKNAYFGNPNNGKNTGEPYAFINFYANPSNPALTFNRIVLSNLGSGTGFESDNHTIATSYVDISGMDINPATPTDLGANPGTTDTKGVEGPNSTLTDSGTAVIGGGGAGALAVIDGGKVIDGATDIGQKPGSSGNVVIDGKGSSLSDTGNAVIGDGGNGTLDITGGGTASDSNSTIGDKPGSSGTVIVDGNGSEWTNTGTLDVGPAAPGVLDITNGGAVIADDGTMVGPKGAIMGDGAITTPTLINDGVVMPTGPNGTAGTLTDNGNYQQSASGTLDIGIGGSQPSQADELKINGGAKLDGTLELAPTGNARAASGDTFEILSATAGVTGNFTNIVDKFNTSRLTRVDIMTPDGFLVTYLPPGHGVVNLALSTSLPENLTPVQLDSFILQALDPNIAQLAAPFDIWFSLANTQRFNLEARFDDVIAGSTGFVSNVTYPAPPPTGKEVTEGKGGVTGKEAAPLAPAPGCRWGYG